MQASLTIFIGKSDFDSKSGSYMDTFSHIIAPNFSMSLFKLKNANNY